MVCLQCHSTVKWIYCFLTKRVEWNSQSVSTVPPPSFGLRQAVCLLSTWQKKRKRITWKWMSGHACKDYLDIITGDGKSHSTVTAALAPAGMLYCIKDERQFSTMAPSITFLSSPDCSYHVAACIKLPVLWFLRGVKTGHVWGNMGWKVSALPW